MLASELPNPQRLRVLQCPACRVFGWFVPFYVDGRRHLQCPGCGPQLCRAPSSAQGKQ